MKYLFFLIIIAVPCRLLAQFDINVTMKSDTVRIGEEFELEVTVTGGVRSIPDPNLPDMSMFEITGRGSSSKAVPFRGKSGTSTTYVYYLSPRIAGEYTIAPFTLDYKGKKYVSRPVRIRVLDEKKHFEFQTSSKADEKDIPKIFIEQEIDKKKPFTGEQIIYTFKIYQRENLMTQPSFVPPPFKGFVREDLPPTRNFKSEIAGHEYLVTEIRCALFAETAGWKSISPAKLIVLVEDESAEDYIDRMLSKGKKKILVTDHINFEVLALPDFGRPSDFSNGVGEFSITAESDKMTVARGEPVSVTVTIEGLGNAAVFEEPELGKLEGFRVYETVIEDHAESRNYLFYSSKIFRIVLVPEIEGPHVIPKVSINYFDPKEKVYKTAESGKIKFIVQPEESINQDETVSGKEPQKQLDINRDDIRYIMDNTGRRAEKPIHLRKGFWSIESIPVMFWMLSFILTYINKNHIQPRYPEILRNRQIKRGLRESHVLLKEGRHVDVYRKIEEVSGRLAAVPEEIRDIVKRAKASVYSPDKADPDRVNDDLKKFIRHVKKGMKSLIWIAVFLLSASGMLEAGDLFSKAADYYSKGDYERASALYIESLDKEGPYEGTMYNLANAYWRMDKPGYARLYWERALQLNPANRDAAYNIGLMSSRLGENMEEDEDLFGRLSDMAGAVTDINRMILAVSVFGWFFMFSFLAYYWQRREWKLWAGMVSGVIFIMIFGVAYLRVRDVTSDDKAIAVNEAVIYHSPGEESAGQGTVPEGSKVKILGSKEEWTEVGIAARNIKFWIKGEYIRKI
ncbi:MAG: BatD family protein [Elusimicrobiota bacterium]